MIYSIYTKNCLLAYIFIISVLLLMPVCSFAGITFNAPEKVAKGDAFIVEVHSDSPAKSFTASWNGKKITVPPTRNSIPTDESGSTAKILLPVSLEEKDSKKILTIEARNSANAVIGTAKKVINFYGKKRPVQKLEVDSKYVSPPANQLARIKKDREKVGKALAQKLDGQYWDVPMERPVSGGISSLFGLKRIFNGQPKGVHKGLDLRGAEGTPVKATSDGKVALVDDLYYSGNTIYINHGDGVFSVYMHLSKALVHPGETVKKGQVIGLVGSTGRVTGPHLHLSMFVQGQSIDPLPLLENISENIQQNKEAK